MYTGKSGCYMHALNDLYIDNSWFGSVEACKKLALRGKDCILFAKQANKGFPKDLIKLTMSGLPGGRSLVMKTMTKKNIFLLAIGYKYNSTTTLCFVATENMGSTCPGSHYKAKYTKEFKKVQARLVNCLAIVSICFNYCGAIDQHNYFSQSQLWLEKH